MSLLSQQQIKVPDDKDWQKLLDEDNISKARAKSEKQFERLSSDEVEYLRRRARTDLFFLAYGILGYNRLSPNLHGNICKWLQSTWETQYRLILLPRAHFKTTVVTVADAIRLILSKGSSYRMLYAHESHEGATRFLYETTSHFIRNPRLMGLFPEFVPSTRIQRMNKYELELPRDGHWAEPTFDTIGVGGHSQGRHYDFIKLDDLFGDKARDSDAERKTTIQWFDNIQAFLVKLSDGHIDLIGTRYSLDDLYGHAIRQYGNRLLRYIRRIKEYNDKENKSNFIFPEEFNDDVVAILKKNPKVWNAQYVNDPREGQAEFDPSWKKYYHYASGGRVAAFFGDSSIATQYKIHDLDIVFLIDPAVSGKSGIVVTGTDDKMHVFVLEAIKERLSPPEFVERLFKLVQKYWPRIVAIEEVLFSAVFKPWIEREQQIRGIRFAIVPVKPKRLRNVDDHSKPGRVRGLSNYFSSHSILFNEGQVDLIEEFDNFGATDDYHLLDALAYGPELWRAGLQSSQFKHYRELEDQVLDERDVLTGYSK